MESKPDHTIESQSMIRKQPGRKAKKTTSEIVRSSEQTIHDSNNSSISMSVSTPKDEEVSKVCAVNL